MKKCALLFLFFITLLTSCSVSDDGTPQFHNEIMPIEGIEMPEQFVIGETYSIDLDYTKPNSCYVFSDFFYEINGNERIVAIINNVYTDSNANCIGDPQLTTVSFNFTVTSTETYIFKFYQGEDVTGEDQYQIVEVPVISE